MLKKIIVIDDEADLCHLVKKILENTGQYSVTAVTEPADIPGLCLTLNPDLLLLDIVMPDMDGREIISNLRKNPATEHIKIIVTSGLGEMVYHEKKEKWDWAPNRPVVQERSDDLPQERSASRAAEVYGVDDYISKPFSPQTLLAVVCEVLARSQESGGESRPDVI